MIIGTAGHIDHGKSALVTALTGRAVDRLAEERRRGITIDLNFAPLDLGAGTVAGIVDVPGHEDFVRTMVAGASGVDVALLVVAANEGIMPQTLEHLLVLEQLRVPLGVPVVTKADLVEPDWLELVLQDLAERLARSPVPFEAPAAVSAVTGAGIAELRARLGGLARTVRARSADDLVRLPVDRAFSVAGTGTVVTGTAWSGSIAVGDRVRLLPSGHEARVRSVEAFGGALERSRPGSRTAVGLAGVEREAVTRGDVLVGATAPWTATRRLDVEVELAPGAPVLGARARVRLHLGTADVVASLRAVEPLVPGGRALARLTLAAPTTARGGDRFVLRGLSPVATIGGGVVLDPAPPVRAAWPPTLRGGDPARRLEALAARRRWGLERAAVPVLAGVTPGRVAELVKAATALAEVGEHLVAVDLLRSLGDRVVAEVEAYHRSHPAEPGPSAETVRQGLRAPEWLAAAIVDGLVARKKLRRQQGAVALPAFTPRPEARPDEVERLVEIVRGAGLTPPSLAELAPAFPRRDPALVARRAVAEGRLVAVERDRWYHPDALAGFASLLAELGAAGEIPVGAVRDRTGASRKYLIPLLEWADRQGITIRQGDERRLARAGRRQPGPPA